MNFKNVMFASGSLVLALSTTPSLAEREGGANRSLRAVQVTFAQSEGSINSSVFESFSDLAATELKENRLLLMKNKNAGREGTRVVCVEFNKFSLASSFSQKVVELIKAERAESTVTSKIVKVCD